LILASADLLKNFMPIRGAVLPRVFLRLKNPKSPKKSKKFTQKTAKNPPKKQKNRKKKTPKNGVFLKFCKMRISALRTGSVCGRPAGRTFCAPWRGRRVSASRPS